MIRWPELLGGAGTLEHRTREVKACCIAGSGGRAAGRSQHGSASAAHSAASPSKSTSVCPGVPEVGTLGYACQGGYVSGRGPVEPASSA